MAASGSRLRLYFASSRVLQALTLANNSATQGQAGSTTVVGRTPGSTLTLTDTVGGVFSINSTTGVLSWTSAIAAGDSHPVIRETLAGATGSPKDTTLTVTAASAGSLVITGFTGGSGVTEVPHAPDVTLYMTPLVAAGDEAIDMQANGLTPISALAVSCTIGSADAAYFTGSTNGTLLFNPTTRAGMARRTYTLTAVWTNAVGSSRTQTISIVVPPDADCRFCSYASGSDAAAGTTPAAAWKHAPGSYIGGVNVNNITLVSKYLFFEGGAGNEHRYTMLNRSSGTNFPLNHHGAVGAPMVYSWIGWKGQAVHAGDDAYAGTWSSVTQAEVYGNPNYANIEKTTLSTPLEYYQQLYCGSVMCFPAQYPTPTVLSKFEGVGQGAVGDTSQGCTQVTYTTNSGVTTKPRLYRDTGSTNGSVCYIVDDALNAIFNNTSVAYNVNGIGVWIIIWAPGNNTTTCPVQQFDATTNTATIDAHTTSINSTGGFTSYGIFGSPYSIVKAGQYGLSQDGLTVYRWKPNSDPVSFGNRQIGAYCGTQPYVIYKGAKFQRLSGGTSRAGATVVGGITFYNFYSSAFQPGIVFSGAQIWQYRTDGGEACGVQNTSDGFDNAIVERFSMKEAIKASGALRSAGRFEGLQTGSAPGGGPTAAEVRAWPTGKVRWNFTDSEGIGRTGILLNKSVGVQITENFQKDCTSVHGNAISLYNDATTTYTWYCVVDYNQIQNTERAYTTSITTTLQNTNRHNTIEGNIFTGRGANATMNMSSSEPGGLITRNIILRSDVADTYWGAAIEIGRSVTCSNNVVCGYLATTGGSSVWNLDNNLLTSNTIPANSGTMEASGNTNITGYPVYGWDGIITSQMQAVLGAGQIGPYRTI